MYLGAGVVVCDLIFSDVYFKVGTICLFISVRWFATIEVILVCYPAKGFSVFFRTIVASGVSAVLKGFFYAKFRSPNGSYLVNW